MDKPEAETSKPDSQGVTHMDDYRDHEDPGYGLTPADANDQGAPANNGLRNLASLAQSLKSSTSPFTAPWLQFTQGNNNSPPAWRTGQQGTIVEFGTQLVARVPDILIGHRKWENRRPVDNALGRAFDGYKPNRAALDSRDEKFWPKDKKTGKPIDPWQFGTFIEFQHPETEKLLYAFAATNRGANDALSNVIDAYVRKCAENPAEHYLPVIELAKGGYEHPDHGWIDTPQLDLVDWVKAPRPTPTNVAASDVYANIKIEAPRTPAKAAARDDLDDDIPF